MQSFDSMKNKIAASEMEIAISLLSVLYKQMLTS